MSLRFKKETPSRGRSETMTGQKYGRVYFKVQSQTWVCKIDGRQYTLSRGRESYTEATEAYAKLVAKMKAGTGDGVEENLKQPLDFFLGFYVDSRLARRKAQSRNRALRYVKSLTEWSCSKPIGQIHATDIEDWLASHERWGNSTKKKVLDELSCYYGWLVKRRYLRHNPVHDIERPREAVRGEEMVMDAETYKRLHAASPAWLQRVEEALWYSGARPSEILLAKAEDYDGRIGAICPKEWKSSWKGLKRQILLPLPLRAYVEVRIQEHPRAYLWPSSKGRQLTVDRLNRWLKHYARKAGLTIKPTSYFFRHSFAVRALEMGLSETEVAGLLGHQGTATLHRHYAHTLARVGSLQKALDRLSVQ